MKILLLTDVPPCREYTGGLVLTRLCSFLPEGSIACMCVQSHQLTHIKMTPELSWIPIEYAVKPQEDTRFHANKLSMTISSLVRDNFNSTIALRPIVRHGVDFGRKFGADIVWCVLQGPSMIRLATRIAQRMGVPLITLIADPPDWWLISNRFDRFSSAQILREYADVIRQSARCGTASWAMAEEYHQAYNTPCIPLVPSIDVRQSIPPTSARTANAAPGNVVDPRQNPITDGTTAQGGNQPEATGNYFTIGLAGQIYAEAEWKALLDALDSVNWKIAEREIKINVMALPDVSRLIPAKNVTMLGWFPQNIALQMLSRNDVNYCPYRFGPDFEKETRLCFPSKLTTYLAAGRPVLFHGPENSSPAAFLRKYNAGAMVHSLEPANVLRVLTQLVTQPDYFERVAQNGYDAYLENLTLTTYRKQFATFLGVEENWLREID
jgi:hypothetical protein